MLWNIAWDMWEARNGIEHKVAMTEETKKADEELSRLIAEYADTTDRNIKQFFTENMIDSLTHGLLRTKLAWLRNVKTAMNRAVVRQHEGSD